MATVNLNRFPSKHELFRLFLKRKREVFFWYNKIISGWMFFVFVYKNFNLFPILKNMNIFREIPYLPIDQYFFRFFYKMNRTTLCQMEKKMSRTAYWKWCTLTVILLDTTDALPIIALDNLMVAKFLSTFYVSVLFYFNQKNV